MSEKAEVHRAFLPAAGHDLFLPLYDPLNRLLGSDRARRALIDQSHLEPGQRVLDVGCGTGTLLLQIRRAFPSTELTGIDPDPKALARARLKAERGQAALRLDEGYADALPYPDGAFDRVFSSLMLHHLEEGDRTKMFSEVRRVLAPEGSFHLMDIAGPEASDGFLARLLHRHARLKDNSASRILDAMRQSGLRDPAKVSDGKMLFGKVAYYSAGR